MDFYTFILYLIGVSGGLIILALALYFFGVRPQTRRLIEESKKLQLKINRLQSEIGGSEPSNFVTDALEKVGIDGVLDSLGIPSVFKPIAKGFIDNLMKDPEKLKSLAKQFGVKLPNDNTTGKEEIGLL